jgi:SAM-dependent methyltransferase
MVDINQRAATLAVKISEATDHRVYLGPFAGMILPNISGNVSPYFLGTYEHELHHVIEQIVSRAYGTVLNIGSGFGYYACGLAKLLPATKVFAVDTDKICQQAVKEMAQLNELSNVHVIDGWDDSAELIVMDIEGAEEDLLKSSRADVLVECHECIKPGITQRLIDRFKDTHNIDIIQNHSAFFNLENLFPGTYIEHFDHAIATWEGRAGQTPWLWCVRKNDVALKAD